MGTFVSYYNFDAETRQSMDLPKKVSVFDTTLRDGEQTPGVVFTGKEKCHIATELSKLGVDIIEAGFPANSEEEQKNIQEITGLGLKSKICTLARAVESDIEGCIKCNPNMVHTFISTSDIHIKYQMNTTREAVMKRAIDSVDKIKNQGFECMFSPMDATRTDFDFLVKVCKEVENAGADIINIPDTVGVMNPPAMRSLFKRLKNHLKIPLDVHCHNDFGLAVPNTLAAVESGASEVQVTVNGLGERAGNANLAQVVMSLNILYGVNTNIKTQGLTEISKLVERLSMIHNPANTPLVGKNAFSHESGIHAAAILKRAETFEPISAEMVGQRSRVVIGKITGRHAVSDALKSIGYKFNEDQINTVTQKIKELAIKQKKISEDDIIAIADEVLCNEPNTEKAIVLEDFSVFTSNKMDSMASVVLSVCGERKKGNAIGIGAVDASYKAISSALGIPFKLSEYNLKAITGGTDALANVLIRIEGNKKEIQAESVHEDIALASVNALIKGMNKMKINELGQAK